MCASSYYYEILGVKQCSRLEEVKKAFRLLVRKNHPDMFPDGQKEIHELKMILINEAYAGIIANLQTDRDPETEKKRDSESDGEPDYTEFYGTPIRNAVGFHKDIQYVYYKQGFDNFSRALNGIKNIERRVRLRNDLYYLKRFSSSLVYLRKADMYFSKLLDGYPESIWAYDAYIKIKKIDYFNRFYRRILQNIERKMKKAGN